MSKKVFKVFALVLTVALLAVMCVGCGSEDVPDNTKATDPVRTTPDVDVTVALPLPTPSPEPTATPEPTPPPITQLPELDTVTAEETPLLYDFMNSVLGWHVDTYRYGEDEGGLVILRHTSSPSIIYTDYYSVQGLSAFPTAGGEIERKELSPQETAKYESCVENSDSKYVFVDGEWELVLLGDGNYKMIYDTGIQFRTADEYSKGVTRPFLRDGSGWPTEWLRREPWHSRLQEAGYNIDDSWWDTFQLYGVYEMVPGEHATPVGSPTITCTGFQTFRFENNGRVQEGVSWNEIRDDCNHIGYNIPGIYNAWDWEPT